MSSHDLVATVRAPALIGLVFALTACPPPKPAEEDGPGLGAQSLPGTDRVVKHGEDLYAEGSAPNLDSHVKRVADGDRNPGAGIPDETNGECRLFDPKLPAPDCCKFETGLDIDDAIKACGFVVYMGEASYGSCGYHFAKKPGEAPVAIRAAPIVDQTMSEAVSAHDTQLKRATDDPSFESKPIPGITGAFWSRHDGEKLNWAFIPGWSTPRRVSWHDDACDRESMKALLAAMAEAKEPPQGATRLDLVPRKRL